MRSPLEDRRRVAPELAALIREMQASDESPAYQSAAAYVVSALEEGTLIGMQSSTSRVLLTTVDSRARAVPAASGALCQSINVRSPPKSDRDAIGWIVVADDYAGGALVLVHEIAHFRNRLLVWQLAQEEAPLVVPAHGAGFDPAQIAWTRAQLLNEIAARHTAYLAHEARGPLDTLPTPAAMLACAVRIASYPHVYNDCGVMARVVASQDETVLRRQVARWIGGLPRFAFFERASVVEAEHRAWLQRVVAYAESGREPAEQAEGTL
jgi:hypothetical protein